MKLNRRNIWLIIGFIILFFIVTAFVFMHRMMNQFDSDEVLLNIRSQQIDIKTKQVEIADGAINVMYTGEESLPKVILIHGSPGHWSDWENLYLTDSLVDSFQLISFDRPGYGNTTISAQMNLNKEAEVARAVMDIFMSEGHTRFIIVGHSYGGAILQKLMIEYPDYIAKAIYVAPTICPDFHKKKWYNYLGAFPLFKIFLPKELKNSNKEMWPLEEELELTKSNMRDFDIPTVFIQGTEDILVPFETISYYLSYDRTNVDSIGVTGMNHFVPWTNPDLIVRAIYQ